MTGLTRGQITVDGCLQSALRINDSVGGPMIDRFCVVSRVLFAFDVKLRNLNYSLFKAYSLPISTNTKNSLIQFGDKIPAVITFSPNRSQGGP